MGAPNYPLPKYRIRNVVRDIYDNKTWVIERCKMYHGNHLYSVVPLDPNSGNTGTTFAEHELEFINNKPDDKYKRGGPMADDNYIDDLPF